MKAVRVRKPKIQSLARADAILAVITRSPGGQARLGEIADALKLHKNTAFSLLETLSALGYVRQLSNSRQYVLGHRLVELARASEAHLDIIHIARPLMLRTVSAVNESVSLAVPALQDALIVSTIESTHGVRGARHLGRHSPYHASAVGKAMMAFMPKSDREAILSSAELPKLTAKTTRTKSALLRQLDEAQKRGFALSLEEEEIGANAVAVPLISPMGEVLGAVAVWGPTPRLTPERLSRLGAGLVKECRELLSNPKY